MLAKEYEAEKQRQEAVGYVRSLCSHASAGQDGFMRSRIIRLALAELSIGSEEIGMPIEIRRGLWRFWGLAMQRPAERAEGIELWPAAAGVELAGPHTHQPRVVILTLCTVPDRSPFEFERALTGQPLDALI
jgi:hypothetical protein